MLDNYTRNSFDILVALEETDAEFPVVILLDYSDICHHQNYIGTVDN